jgi:F-type H+-transporting ATPase subunit b
MAFAEEHGTAPKEAAHAAEAEHGGGDPYIWWKWANFGILAIVLGYMLGKALPPFFASRTAEIQKGIAEASRLKADAERRAAEMERRMTALASEIEQIRVEARAQMVKEGERIQRESQQQMARIQAQAEREVAAITKHATAALKAESARLALELAEQRLRSRIDAGAQGMLVERFVKQMDQAGVRG